MPNILNLDQNLTPEQLRKAIEILVDQTIAKIAMFPEQKEIVQQKKEQIVENLVQAVTSKNDSITLNDFKNDGLMNKLIVNTMTAVLVDKHLNKLFIDDLFEKLKKLNPKFDPKLINKPEDLKNFFTEKQLSEILTPEVIKKLNDFYVDMNKNLSPLSTKPEFVQKKTASDDPYVNLFGLINSHTTGGYAAVVQHNWGNSYNLPDWNPYHGTAQIDRQNVTNEALAGDPMGLNASKIANFLKEGATSSGELVDEMRDRIRIAAPTPKPGT
jgi:hypothetical protein